eukprot:IDg23843t1
MEAMGLVSPEFSTRPRRNDVSAPVYPSGDFVFFDAVRWAPEVPGRMVGPMEPFKEGELLIGELSFYRDGKTGRGRPTAVFEGPNKMDVFNEYEEELAKGLLPGQTTKKNAPRMM